MSDDSNGDAPRPNPYHPINAYRMRVLSDRGPSCYGARLVLLALLQHANYGMLAWPSQATLARETKFSERSVRKYAKAAEQERWCSTFSRRVSRGHQWYETFYMLHTPEEAANIAATNAAIEQAEQSAGQEAQSSD